MFEMSLIFWKVLNARNKYPGDDVACLGMKATNSSWLI